MTAIPSNAMLPPPAPQHAGDLDKLRAAAVALEASFLAEMLKSAGLGETKGTFSGGTAASLTATMKAAAKKPALINVLRNPFALAEGFEGPSQPTGMVPLYEKDLDKWAAPFVMAPINTKNVHRTNALLGHPYGKDFQYDEMMLTSPGDAGKKMAEAAAEMMKNPFGAKPPKPGEGPSKEERENTSTGRPLTTIMAQPRFMVSVLCATGSYALMAYVMTGAPLAMALCGFTPDDSTWGIQWHVMAMFGPSFFTGNLITRFGKEKIVAAGMALLIACALVGLAGITLANFYIALILLGVGWNFGFIGATAMLTDCYEPAEKSKAQGANDFILFGFVAFGSFMSGTTLNLFGEAGWDAINIVVFPVTIICLGSLAWLALRSRRSVAD